ncbi:MAG: hypothetical protein P8X42_06785, partial [Calditrichaceae bacterium]
VGELVSAHVIPNPFDDTRLIFGPGSSSPKPAASKANKTNTKKSISASRSRKKETQPDNKADARVKMLDWLASQKNGANLSRIAGKLNLDNAGARRIVKELMDEGCIEKVHQVYFFLKQTDK